MKNNIILILILAIVLNIYSCSNNNINKKDDIKTAVSKNINDEKPIIVEKENGFEVTFKGTTYKCWSQNDLIVNTYKMCNSVLKTDEPSMPINEENVMLMKNCLDYLSESYDSTVISEVSKLYTSWTKEDYSITPDSVNYFATLMTKKTNYTLQLKDEYKNK